MTITVYCGTTSSEVETIRDILIEQVRQAGMLPDMLSESEQTDDEALSERIRVKIKAADRYIGIVTYTRAWEPKQLGGKTIPEFEFELANEFGKMPVILVPEADSDIGQHLRRGAMRQDPIYREAQRSTMNRMQSTVNFVYFDDEADLSVQIAQILGRWAAQENMAAMPPPPRSRLARLLNLDHLIDQIATQTATRINLLDQRNQAVLAEQALKYQDALRLKPGELVFGKPLMSSQFQSDVFVIMPFAPAYDPVYKGVIQPLIGDLKLRCVRGDQFTSSRGSIIEEVWAALNGCRFVIADLSGSNLNVLYELGIAHTLNKSAILITQADRPEDVPFDIRHLRYIQYRTADDGLERLRGDLQTAIRWLLADLEESWA